MRLNMVQANFRRLFVALTLAVFIGGWLAGCRQETTPAGRTSLSAQPDTPPGEPAPLKNISKTGSTPQTPKSGLRNGETRVAALQNKAPGGNSTRAKTPPAQIAEPPAPTSPAMRLTSKELLQKTAPAGSGPGVVVCEPVAQNARAQIAAFGAGCGRWLHLAVGGHGEFGKTPLWGAVDDARLAMGKPDLRFAPQDAARLARKLGITHAATGRISGDATRCTLTYQLWQVPSRKPVGAPLTATGARQQVVARLPELARQMAARLGAAPRVPATVGADAAQLSLLGQVPWKARKAFALPTSQERPLRLLATRLPLAGVLLMRSWTLDPDDPLWDSTLKSLFAQAGDNTLVIGDVSRKAVRSLALYYSGVLRQRKRFPNNYLLATAVASWHGNREERALQRKAAEQAIRCSPRNPLAWQELGGAISAEAQDLRRGRYISRMTAAELSFVGRLYPQALQAAAQATRLDPEDGAAWLQVCKAAAFNGMSELADAAFQKALRLSPNDADVLAWGLQLYRPKWQGDRNKLVKLVKRVTEDDALFFELHQSAVYALRDTGLASQAQALLMKSVAMLESTVRREPNNAAWRIITGRNWRAKTVTTAARMMWSSANCEPTSGSAPMTPMKSIILARCCTTSAGNSVRPRSSTGAPSPCGPIMQRRSTAWATSPITCGATPPAPRSSIAVPSRWKKTACSTSSWRACCWIADGAPKPGSTPGALSLWAMMNQTMPSTGWVLARHSHEVEPPTK